MTTPKRLVLIRHGQSIWNTQHRLTGWADVALSARGEHQARAAGVRLRREQMRFDHAYTSMLHRATESLRLVLAGSGDDIPVTGDWRLNERHYGALEGLGPVTAVMKFGIQHVVSCQRRFDVVPPLLALKDQRFPGNQPLFDDIPRDRLPRAESMADTWRRVAPLWTTQLVPALHAGRRILIVAHKNSLRAVIKHLSGCSARHVERLRIPTGQPLVYELDPALRVLNHYLLEC